MDFVIGFKADTLDDAPRTLVRPDLVGRIGRYNVIELEPLSAASNVQRCVEDILSHLVEHGKASALIKDESLPAALNTFPFTAAAFTLLCDYPCGDPTKSTPRNIIKAIIEYAIQAWDQQKRVIDDSIVNEIAPIVSPKGRS